MLIVLFFRWLFGYYEFTIEGKFPERFLNLASRNGINLWNMNGGKDKLKATAKISDKENIIRFAEKSGTTHTIEKEHGLPYFCKTYKYRLGLLAGLVLGAAMCAYLSGFIWNIQINAPKGINEYEIRSELRELGFYEGIYYKTEDVSRYERLLKLSDDRISWISINIFGTNAVVEISPKQVSDKRNENENKNEQENTVSNLKANADGTVTRIEVQNGTAAVKVGDGVRKGQLLVSGIMEYTNGNNVFADSQGKVYAKTAKTVTLTMPKAYNKITLNENTAQKQEIEFFGIRLPASVNGSPSGDFYKTTESYRATLLDNDLPIKLHTENWQGYDYTKTALSPQEAEQLLKNRLKLYEFFLQNSGENFIMSESTKFTEEEQNYCLTVQFEIEKNICEKSYIDVKTEES